jgi:hypothetical protein
MPGTALRHFDEDLARARELVRLASGLPHGTPQQRLARDDVLRSAWMFAAGAADAYFCDAYADVVAALLITKTREPHVNLPTQVDDLKVPASTILDHRPVRDNWKWRMAARALIEKQNILSLAAVQTHFNQYCRPGHKLFSDVIDAWASDRQATARVFGMTNATYRAAVANRGAARDQARRSAKAALLRRFDEGIFQRRHDCIHNCDRPHTRPQLLEGPGTVRNAIVDIEFVVRRFDTHITQELRQFMIALRFSLTGISQVGY